MFCPPVFDTWLRRASRVKWASMRNHKGEHFCNWYHCKLTQGHSCAELASQWLLGRGTSGNSKPSKRPSVITKNRNKYTVNNLISPNIQNSYKKAPAYIPLCGMGGHKMGWSQIPLPSKNEGLIWKLILQDATMASSDRRDFEAFSFFCSGSSSVGTSGNWCFSSPSAANSSFSSSITYMKCIQGLS